jgi:hypothetical protein
VGDSKASSIASTSAATAFSRAVNALSPDDWPDKGLLRSSSEWLSRLAYRLEPVKPLN